MKRLFKKGLIFSACLLGVIIAVPLIYVIYLQLTYYRIDDNVSLEITNGKDVNDESLLVGNDYTVMTYNIGFGAYDREYSFFMDKAILADDNRLIKGKYGRAVSKEHIITNTDNAAKVMYDNRADFYLIQEVDRNSTRSYKVNQSELIFDILGRDSFSSNYAVNYHSAYLALPLHDMHGKANAGLLTISNKKIEAAVRRSYPVSKNFVSKFFDLDRCFSVNKIPVDNGKYLLLVNHHMSAYDKGGKIRKLQLDMLNEFLENEIKNGNYIIVGGDFNHDYCNSAALHKGNKQVPSWLAVMSDDDLTDGYRFIIPENIDETGSCRGAESPYDEKNTYQSTIDGFIVSDNIDAVSHIVDTKYLASDHNPVMLEFKLK